MGRSLVLESSASEVQAGTYINLDVEGNWGHALSHLEVEWERVSEVLRVEESLELDAEGNPVKYARVALQSPDGSTHVESLKSNQEYLTVIHSDGELVRVGDGVRLGNERFA